MARRSLLMALPATLAGALIVTVIPRCQSAPSDSTTQPASRPASTTAQADANDWPQTLDQAVTKLLADLGDEDKALLRALPQEDMICFHHGWGTGIRNSFGLWRGNVDLLKSCTENQQRITGRAPSQPPDAHVVLHPDNASMVIIEAVWLALRESPASTAPAGKILRICQYGGEVNGRCERYRIKDEDFLTVRSAMVKLKSFPDLSARSVQVIADPKARSVLTIDLLRQVIAAGCRNVQLVRTETEPTTRGRP